MARLRLLIALPFLLAITSMAAVAVAQATVQVEVRAPDGSSADARVTLTPQGGGSPQSCQTTSGVCQIAGLSSGTYIVTASPSGAGRPPIPRPVLIPPDGQVTVRLSLR